MDKIKSTMREYKSSTAVASNSGFLAMEWRKSPKQNTQVR